MLRGCGRACGIFGRMAKIIRWRLRTLSSRLEGLLVSVKAALRVLARYPTHASPVLIRPMFPPLKEIRLVCVPLSNFEPIHEKRSADDLLDQAIRV